MNESYAARVQRLGGNIVQKWLMPRDVYAQRLAEQMLSHDPILTMQKYISALLSVHIPLPPKLEVTERVVITHDWVEGITCQELLMQSPDTYLGVVRQIGDWQVALSAQCLDARLDMNLDNFLLQKGKIILIDVLPPLLPSRMYEPVDIYEAIFVSLCFDRMTSLTALLSYAVHPLLFSTWQDAIAIEKIAAHWGLNLQAPFENRRPRDLFWARLDIALKSFRGSIRRTDVQTLYQLTSLRTLRSLASDEQESQVALAWQLYDMCIRNSKGTPT